MNIAVFHYFVTNNNPAGKCVRELVDGLSSNNRVTVFACAFDNPCPDKIRWVKVPAIYKPLFLLYLTFFFVAPIYYLKCRLLTKYDRIIYTESRVPLIGIAYAHFCHGAYLKGKWRETGTKGILRILRYVNHVLHAWGEKTLYPRVGTIVVPSQGLKREILQAYAVKDVVVIPNPIRNEQMVRPPEFSVARFRERYKIGAVDLMMVFAALGNFELKGLDIVLDALSKVNAQRHVKLVVVGGSKTITNKYTRLAKDRKIEDMVIFVGMQKDVRPFLWASDVFIFPSLYETFSLVVLEAAAAGLVLIVTNVYGVEEYVRNGVNGFVVERDATAVAKCIATVLSFDKATRYNIGEQAQKDVQRYSCGTFIRSWTDVLQRGVNA